MKTYDDIPENDGVWTEISYAYSEHVYMCVLKRNNQMDVEQKVPAWTTGNRVLRPVAAHPW